MEKEKNTERKREMEEEEEVEERERAMLLLGSPKMCAYCMVPLPPSRPGRHFSSQRHLRNVELKRLAMQKERRRWKMVRKESNGGGHHQPDEEGEHDGEEVADSAEEQEDDDSEEAEEETDETDETDDDEEEEEAEAEEEQKDVAKAKEQESKDGWRVKRRKVRDPNDASAKQQTAFPPPKPLVRRQRGRPKKNAQESLFPPSYESVAEQLRLVGRSFFRASPSANPRERQQECNRQVSEWQGRHLEELRDYGAELKSTWRSAWYNERKKCRDQVLSVTLRFLAGLVRQENEQEHGWDTWLENKEELLKRVFEHVKTEFPALLNNDEGYSQYKSSESRHEYWQMTIITWLECLYSNGLLQRWVASGEVDTKEIEQSLVDEKYVKIAKSKRKVEERNEDEPTLTKPRKRQNIKTTTALCSPFPSPKASSVLETDNSPSSKPSTPSASFSARYFSPLSPSFRSSSASSSLSSLSSSSFSSSSSSSVPSSSSVSSSSFSSASAPSPCASSPSPSTPSITATALPISSAMPTATTFPPPSTMSSSPLPSSIPTSTTTFSCTSSSSSSLSSSSSSFVPTSSSAPSSPPSSLSAPTISSVTTKPASSCSSASAAALPFPPRLPPLSSIPQMLPPAQQQELLSLCFHFVHQLTDILNAAKDQQP